MSVALNRTAVILLASGLSRRYGRKDKMLASLGGRPLVEHAAGVVAGLDALARVAVCPADSKEVGERLGGRFVIALNKEPKSGLGHSIAVGVQVALQFRPDAMLFVMADMPFVEEAMLHALLKSLGGRGGADIVHSGGADGVRSPTAFGAACFEALAKLDGDDGAKSVVRDGGFKVVGIAAPAPLLIDVDTKEDLDLAERQLSIRAEHTAKAPAARPKPAPVDLSQYQLGPRPRVARR
jgi:molybdenum cofactor cytidylyltransferase